MRRTRTTILAVAAATAALALAACGGDDNNDDADITEAIEQAATNDSPEVCTEFQTVAFNEQTQYETGDAAVQACEDDAGNGDTAGDSVEVSNIEVDGDTATADVAFTGGGLDAQELAVGLVKEDDQWKLDSLDEFVTFDKEAFSNALVSEAEADGDTPPQVLDCLQQQLDATGEEELQSAYLSGDEQQLVDLFGSCFQGA